MTKAWPDDYSEDELVAEAVDEVVEGTLEGASFHFCVQEVQNQFDPDLRHRQAEIRERARQRLEERGNVCKSDNSRWNSDDLPEK